MASVREQLKSEIFRSRVRALLELGYSLARIAKETGKSITHVKQIAKQERSKESAQP